MKHPITCFFWCATDGLRLSSVPLSIAESYKNEHTSQTNIKVSDLLLKARQLMMEYLSQQHPDIARRMGSGSPVALSEVLAEYEIVTERLRAEGKQSYLVQALHELGNMHFHANNLRSVVVTKCQLTFYGIFQR